MYCKVVWTNDSSSSFYLKFTLQICFSLKSLWPCSPAASAQQSANVQFFFSFAAAVGDNEFRENHPIRIVWLGSECRVEVVEENTRVTIHGCGWVSIMEVFGEYAVDLCYSVTFVLPPMPIEPDREGGVASPPSAYFPIVCHVRGGPWIEASFGMSLNECLKRFSLSHSLLRSKGKWSASPFVFVPEHEQWT